MGKGRVTSAALRLLTKSRKPLFRHARPCAEHL